jgi:hypothetical protein
MALPQILVTKGLTIHISNKPHINFISFYISALKAKFIILFISGFFAAYAQNQPPAKVKFEYFKNEEVIHHAKRYRIHNNYLSFGPGFLGSALRNADQKVLGIDFQWHIRRQHFQTGVMMSGDSYGSNNNLQAHIGYGWRKETTTYNFAWYAGPSYFTGVLTIRDSLQQIKPKFYQSIGLYTCAQAIYKITYDIGIGLEVFGEYSPVQSSFGIKIITFFSSAYVGPKRNDRFYYSWAWACGRCFNAQPASTRHQLCNHWQYRT